MSHKGWCTSVILLRALVALVIWGRPVGVLQGVKAVVAYSTQHETPPHAEAFSTEPLQNFPELWRGIFLWGFFSTLFIHSVAAIIAFLMLRRHKYGR